MIQESVPMISVSETSRPPIMALNTYRGDVPISPKIIPSAITSPAAVTLLVGIFTCYYLYARRFQKIRRRNKGIGKKTNGRSLGIKNFTLLLTYCLQLSAARHRLSECNPPTCCISKKVSPIGQQLCIFNKRKIRSL